MKTRLEGYSAQSSSETTCGREQKNETTTGMRKLYKKVEASEG